ncbi:MULTISPECIES: hypothetical protein [unclassified Streptococcus]|nr:MULTISPECIES: hypothetical protein [unclassified Streptococcus]
MRRYLVADIGQGGSVSGKAITVDNKGAQVINLFTLSSGKEQWTKYFAGK